MRKLRAKINVVPAFMLAGIVNYSFDLMVLNITFALTESPEFSIYVSTGLGTLFAFFTMKSFVFSDAIKGRLSKEVFWFLFFAVATHFLSLYALEITSEIFGSPDALTLTMIRVTVLGLIFILKFFLYRFVVFKRD